jgi:hypothetical protein
MRSEWGRLDFEHLVRWPDDRIVGRIMLIEDFNTGPHLLDEAGSTFVADGYFDRLNPMGWVDAWRHFRADARKFGWFSSRGSDCRVDHLLCRRAHLESVRWPAFPEKLALGGRRGRLLDGATVDVRVIRGDTRSAGSRRGGRTGYPDSFREF